MSAVTMHSTTREVVAAMLVENTGRSILDSGDAYGRGWERNAGRTVADWEAQPAAWLDDWAGPVLSVFHFLADRVTFCPELDTAFGVFADGSDSPWLAAAEGFADSLTVASEFEITNRWGLPEAPRTWNTYNGEDYLSQILQGVTFTLDGSEVPGVPGGVYALIQIHGGCDARGGYTRPRAFSVDVDMAEAFPYDHADAYVFCTGEDCPVRFDVRGGYVENGYDCPEGVPSNLYELERVDGKVACPVCSAPLAVEAPEPY